MKTEVICIALILIIPILMLLFFLEKRAKRIVLSMIIGIFVGALAYFTNTKLSRFFPDGVSYLTFGAPVAEEILKFVSVLVFSLIINKGKRGSTANAYAIGVGFCVIENLDYLIAYLDVSNVFWIITRCIGAGLMHSITTATYGVGIFTAKKKKSFGWLRVTVSLILGIAFHMTYNALMQTEHLSVIGVLMPVLVYIIIFALVKGDGLRNFLYDNDKQN